MKIVYVDVDTLRADHTGAYGYQRDITPNLDAMAKDSVCVDRYYCSDSEQADDLYRHLHPDNGALGASWTAQGPLMSPEERVIFMNFLAAQKKPEEAAKDAGDAVPFRRLLGVREASNAESGA
ncbi:hypothetical protein KO481_40685 [Nocardia sp. NEAU-G5]|uniref:Uncharacterized protein n=1 Tax=Nocardia albiluteola TaxID=2842303 RepID=A0ABS6BC06_9NOCA|nr:hypothetical protein [Nocardia albiluteola]MBU3067819.1 hypothetical protein [Nocardia albiluteola]